MVLYLVNKPGGRTPPPLPETSPLSLLFQSFCTKVLAQSSELLPTTSACLVLHLILTWEIFDLLLLTCYTTHRHQTRKHQRWSFTFVLWRGNFLLPMPNCYRFPCLQPHCIQPHIITASAQQLAHPNLPCACEAAQMQSLHL